MSFNDLLYKFCGNSKVWDWDVSWNTTDPRLSRCFHQTFLTWIPTTFISIAFIFEFISLLKLKNRDTHWNLFNISKLVFSLIASFIQLSHLLYLVYLNYLPSSRIPSQADLCSCLLNAYSFVLAAIIIFLHKKKGKLSSGIVWLYLLVKLVFLLLIYLQLWTDLNEYDQVSFIFYSFDLVVIVIFLTLSSFSDRSNLIQDNLDESPTDDEKLKAIRYPEQLASFPSRLTFSWFDKIIYRGWRKPLIRSDLPETKPNHKAEYLSCIFDKGVSKVTSVNGPLSSKKGDLLGLWFLFKDFGPSFLLGSFFKLLHDICILTNPQILRALIDFIEKDSNEPQWHGILFAILLFAVSTLQTLFLAAYFHRVYAASLQWKSYAMINVFKKSLNLSQMSRKQTTIGQIVNMMAVDSQKITDAFPFINMLWSAPFQLLTASYFLYNELGYSVLCGFATVIILLPINAIVTTMNKKVQARQMKHKDERVKQMNEVLAGIKIIKLYGWESSFINTVRGIRDLEIRNLKKFLLIGLVNMLSFNLTPLIFSVTAFGVYVAVAKQTLTPQKAFVSLALFNILRFPLAMVPLLLNLVVMATVSFKRFYNFFRQDEISTYVTRDEHTHAVVIKNGAFTWSKTHETNDGSHSMTDITVPQTYEFQLKDINLEIEKGSFVAIIGKVGSGKSSLLSAILGEMCKQSGDINIDKNMKIAYVSQHAWIQNLAFKDNITFGKPLDENKLNDVITACKLDFDLKVLPAGLDTEIGDKGINLSGGQKQRLSLARACYSGTDLYLLDDPLSAVDPHVARALDELVISSSGILKNKTRVLVTNNINILKKVDKIIVLKNGQIDMVGSYQHLISNDQHFASFIKNFSLGDFEKTEKESNLNENELTTSKSEQSLVSSEKGKLVKEEEAETGSVKFKMYIEYFKMLSYEWFFICIAGFALAAVFYMGSNLWLAAWSNDASKGQARIDERLSIYVGLAICQVIFTLVGGYALVRGTERASKQAHHRLVYRVLRSPMTFFETTPLGRILNRFSKDIDALDSFIPDCFKSWLICLFSTLSTLSFIILQTPLFIVFMIPLTFFYYFIQKMYVASSRQLKRLESITRSPIFSYFDETLAGVMTIRAFNETSRFVKEFIQQVDYNQIFRYTSIVANRWLSVRLEFIANFIALFAALFAVLSKNGIEAGNAGLSITYAISVSQVLNWFIQMTSELETNIVAVERIVEYCSLDQESDWNKGEIVPVANWPAEGKIEFCNYSTRYRKGLDLVLKNISALIQPKEKIGIIGRTGAGKSSITLSLFRILEAVEGAILIDDYDISKFALHHLRSKLTIIPQDPILFSGTLRYNLDPFNKYTDEEIWASLENVQLKEFVEKLDGRIYYVINEGGTNLSKGQQQLICLARALLKRPKILVLDEATAAMDLQTDSLIQETIRREFKDCTILTIAHRLNTILDSDRVLVLENGRIIEFDSPARLLKNPNSVLSTLARDASIIRR